MRIKWHNHNRAGHITITCISLLFNVVLLSIIFDVCINTNLYKMMLSKVGLIEYNVDDSRRQVELRTMKGWANTIEKMNLKPDVVFYGNSITYESDFQLLFPDICICNLGCNRDDLDDLIFRSFMIKSVHPHKLFLLGGINKLMDISLEEFKQKYIELVDTIIKQNPYTQIFLQSLLPINVNMEIGERYVNCITKIKQANNIIKEISRSRKCTYIDLYSAYQDHDSLPRKYTRDGLHLKPEAYTIWAHEIKPFIEE